MVESRDSKEAMYFEDFEVGQELTSEEATITQDRVNAFAFAGGDDNPLHLDPEWAAKRLPFRKQIAHGELAAAVITALGAHVIGFESIMLHMETDTRFVGAIYPGDTVYVVMTVTKVVDTNKRCGTVVFVGKLINQNDKVVAEGGRELTVLKREPKNPPNDLEIALAFVEEISAADCGIRIVCGEGRDFNNPYVAAAILGALERGIDFEVVVGPILAIEEKLPVLDVSTHPIPLLVKRINTIPDNKKASIYLCIPGDIERFMNDPYLNAAISASELGRGVKVDFVLGPPPMLINPTDKALERYFGPGIRTATIQEVKNVLNPDTPKP